MDMSDMDMSDSIGQLMMVGIPHPTLDTETRDTLYDLKPGGVILFGRHNQLDLLSYSSLKRYQVDVLNAILFPFISGQILVRIHQGCAVAGEMFAAWNNACLA